MLNQSLVFFFQAEDGIRDGHVTGVQTCALPISRSGTAAAAAVPDRGHSAGATATGPHRRRCCRRSEERRVGKESRTQRALQSEKTTKENVQSQERRLQRKASPQLQKDQGSDECR